MNKTLLILALTLIGVSACPHKAYAEDKEDKDEKKEIKKELGLTLDVGVDVTSSYLWRGYNLGGISIQPSVTLDWEGLYVSGWANIGADNWTFENLNPELDITIGYDNYGVQVDLTHLYYFENTPYFPKGGCQGCPNEPNPMLPEDKQIGDEWEQETTMEAHIGFHLGDIIESVPLSVDWYTTVFGKDCYVNNNDTIRAWSTYIELGYDFNLPLGLLLGARVGIVPWRSSYTGYQEVWTNAKTVAINNINLRLERDFELKHLFFGVWGEVMLNCYGLDKTNLTTTLENKFDQRLNWRFGASLYLGNEW